MGWYRTRTKRAKAPTNHCVINEKQQGVWQVRVKGVRLRVEVGGYQEVSQFEENLIKKRA